MTAACLTQTGPYLFLQTSPIWKKSFPQKYAPLWDQFTSHDCQYKKCKDLAHSLSLKQLFNGHLSSIAPQRF